MIAEGGGSVEPLQCLPKPRGCRNPMCAGDGNHAAARASLRADARVPLPGAAVSPRGAAAPEGALRGNFWPRADSGQQSGGLSSASGCTLRQGEAAARGDPNPAQPGTAPGRGAAARHHEPDGDGVPPPGAVPLLQSRQGKARPGGVGGSGRGESSPRSAVGRLRGSGCSISPVRARSLPGGAEGCSLLSSGARGKGCSLRVLIGMVWPCADGTDRVVTGMVGSSLPLAPCPASCLASIGRCF